jgi:hypothetical protein
VSVKYVLADPATGTRIRHRIYTWREAIRQKESYERLLGRPIRVEKRFGSKAVPLQNPPASKKRRRVRLFEKKLMCLRCRHYVARQCSLGCRPGDARCVL